MGDMRRRTWATVALAALLALAGCLGGVGGQSQTGPSTTATPTPPQTSASADGGAGTPANAPSDGTPTQTYTAPTGPNRPTETSDENRNRIVNAKFVNKVESSDGNGYSHFDIRMLANTSMQNVDPPNVDGDVEGEPYAIVLVNGKLVERTDYLEMRDRGRYTIDVRMAGFEHNNVQPGKLRVKVLLMDQDKAHGDVFGTWSGTIRYAK